VRAIKPHALWEGVVEIKPNDHWLPTVLGKTDRPG